MGGILDVGVYSLVQAVSDLLEGLTLNRNVEFKANGLPLIVTAVRDTVKVISHQFTPKPPVSFVGTLCAFNGERAQSVRLMQDFAHTLLVAIRSR